MEKFHSTFWGYRIYRKKFRRTLFTMILLSAVVLGGMLLFFMNMWMSQRMQWAQEQYLEGEKRMKNVDTMTEQFLNEMYGNKPLMDDVRAVLDAQNEQEYLNIRRQNSLSSSVQIAYLPGRMKRLFLSGQGSIDGAVLTVNGKHKVIWHDTVSGDMNVSFEIKREEDTGSIVGFGNLPVTTCEIRDPDYMNHFLGTIRFYVDSADLYESYDDPVESWSITGCGTVPEEHFQTEKGRRWLETAALSEETHGWIRDNGWNRAYYMKMESAQGDYTYTVVLDRLELLKENRKSVRMWVWMLVFLNVGVLATSYLGIADDAAFLRTIMQILKALEEGRFADVPKTELPKHQKENEYGMIAVALKDVSRKMEQYIQTEYILKLKEQETAMRALQHQINPHFLYNTLETIRSGALMKEDYETADAIALLGTLYRARMHKADIITIKEEFGLLEVYLHIMQLRFGESFLYQTELEPEAEAIKTVNFWMQPLAENFFTHGFDRGSEFNLLIVNGYMENDGVHIDIIDNGKGIEPSEMEQILKNMYEGNDDPEADIGLRNVYMRLRWFYGEKFRMEIRNNAEGGVCISIFIPNGEGNHVRVDDCRR